jgi:hypothetical protein
MQFEKLLHFIWFGCNQKGGNPETNEPLSALVGAHRTTLQVDRKAHTQHNHIADSHSGPLSVISAKPWLRHITAPMQDSSLNYLFTQILKAKFHIPFIHTSVFTISPTAQAPISPLLQNLATL